MRIYAILLNFIFCFFVAHSQTLDVIKICSWNIRDFGKSKSTAQIWFIADKIKEYDIILIQEVVAKDPGGAQAVGRLGDALNDMGDQWDYRISDCTSGENSYKRERYAYLWKSARVKLVGKPWLEKKYAVELDREPFYATFLLGEKEFTLANFHAITKRLQPEIEVKYFKFLPDEYPNLNLIFCGDFNLPQDHSVFNPLKKMGYLPVLIGQKTSLKKVCLNGECLASEFDNFFYKSEKVTKVNGGILPFYTSFSTMDEAFQISDHVPIYFEFFLN